MSPDEPTQWSQRIGGSQVYSWGPEPRSGVPVLVALHGWSDGGVVFQFLARRLFPRAVIFAPDAVGHGDTAWTGKRFSLDELVTPACEVVDGLVARYPFLAEDGVVLYGHSMGALTAAAVAGRRPNVVRGLILEEPPRRPASLRWLRYRYSSWHRRLAAMEPEARLAHMQEFTQWSREELEVWWATKEQLDLAMLDVFARWGSPAWRLLARLKVPTLLLHGRRPASRRLGRSQAWWWMLHSVRRDMRVVALDSEHNLRREAPEELAVAVRVFLDDLQQGRFVPTDTQAGASSG